MPTHRSLFHSLSILVILTMLFSGVALPPASAQGPDGIERQINAQTGKVSFIGPESGQALAARDALNTAIRPQDPALALAKRFAPEFGLQDPERELSQMKSSRAENGRITARYQQSYQGIPVLGGELIVNTNDNGDLYSMNGEVSPALSLSTQPKIGAEEARQTALQAIAKWHKKAPEDFSASEPALWIYDESLLRPSTRPAELVWRMEVTARDTGLPVRELVLVNTQRGNISLHFNQIDTAWAVDGSAGAVQDPDPTPTPLPTETPVVTETTPPTGEPISSEVPDNTSTKAVMALDGATWYVATTGDDSNSCSTPDSPCATINGAIAKAGAGDTVWVAQGTYTASTTEVARIENSINLSGGWNASFSAQSGRSIIDGQNARLGIYAKSAGNVVIDRFIVRNSPGPGINNSSSTVTLSNSIVTNNNQSGIYSYGTLTVNHTAVIDNFTGRAGISGGGGGAGIESHGTLTLNHTTVSRNTIRGGFTGSGIYASDTLTLNNSTVTGNTGGNGVGIYIVNGPAYMNNSTISNHQAHGIGIAYGALYMQNSIIAGNGSGGDCRGFIISRGYNLIGDPAHCSFAETMGDLFHVSPKLGKLVGFPGYLPLSPDSPAVNTGNPAAPGSGESACLATDQRGVTRPALARCDMGAYEYTIPEGVARLVIQDGDEQRAGLNLAFPRPLVVAALDGQSSPVAGVSVTLTAPGSGAGGTFVGTGTQTTTLITDANGLASVYFKANSLVGAYPVTASASGAEIITFNLQNKAWFVAAGGSDSNSCSTPASPCATIDGAVSRISNGDIIQIATGEYTGSADTGIVISGKSVILSGGWNATFTAQSGLSTINGQGVRRGISADSDATVTLDRFKVWNAFDAGINNYNSIMVVNNSIITGNQGVGIQNNAVMTINNTTISNNTGYSSGGGISNHNRGTLTLNNSLVVGNRSSYHGSGIDTSGDGELFLNNSTVSTNMGGDGAGIHVFGSKVFLKNSTIAFNQTTGIINDLGTVTLQNTLIARNGKGSDCQQNGQFVSLGYNLIGNGSWCTITAATGDKIGSNSDPILPWLAPLQNNGGPTQTHALMVGSPALNAGNPAVPGSSSSACLATDQRGVARPAQGRCDIGAHEGSVPWIPPTPIVNTYTAGKTSSLPGTLLCTQSDSNCAAGDAQAKAAHKYAIGTYNLYASQHLRDGIDNARMAINSTVHYCRSNLPCPYANAFWNGAQMVYGDKYGFPLADDVVAHELTHGVTERESNLFYYYQSGAINESFSDLWGEYYDQTNGLGTDTAAVKWAQGEDILGKGAGRSMSNPPGYGDPDRISSPYYYKGQDDGGGVHTNSGVNNKAVYLMVDGGTFNGRTVTALGWKKTAAIYYEVNTKLLSSGADYSDLYYALQRACSSLIGTNGITAVNCADVKDALDAVEMNGQPAAGFNPDAPLCTTPGTIPKIIFADDLENNSTNWTFVDNSDSRWRRDSPYGTYAHSGLHFLYADDYPDRVTDASVGLGARTIPNGAYLHFAQAYDFEEYYGVYYDGGVLEFSLNNGATWVDASWLIDYNGYKGAIYSQYNNPLAGRPAFVGSSHGYISTRLNLAPLAGQSVAFRWRMGLDGYGAAWGWWVDNLKLYTCGLPKPDAFNKTAPSDAAINQPTSLALGWEASSGATLYQYCYDTTNDGACSNWLDNGNSTNKILTGLSPKTTFYWHVRAVNSNGTTYSNGSPTAFRSFTTIDLPGAFNKTSPSNGGTNIDLSTMLSWSGSALAASYQYCYDTIDDNQCNRSWNSVSTTFIEISNLGSDTTYYWQVRALNAAGIRDADNQIWGTFTTTATLPPDTTEIETFIGTNRQGKYSLGNGQSLRESYMGVNSGPVKILSTGSTPLLGAERVVYKVNNIPASFTELMGLPDNQLDTVYWLPWYNNVELDTQLRFANVSDSTATVHIYIGEEEMTGSPFTLEPGESARKSFPGVSAGPVKIESDVNIVAAERIVYKVNGIGASFTEMMAMPNSQLDTTYFLPWYNNVELDTQLRFANVSDTLAAVRIYIGGEEMSGSPFTLEPGVSTRQSFVGINAGPVKIESDVPIVAAERVVYKVNGINTSFIETMGLPAKQLDTTYWLPWYNNVELDTQLRFANVSDTQASVHVYIGGVEMTGSPFTLEPGASTRQSFAGINAGPVQIVSDVPIVAAERVVYKVNGIGTSFSEMMGLPDGLLDPAYWLPCYNNVELDTQLRFGVP